MQELRRRAMRRRSWVVGEVPMLGIVLAFGKWYYRYERD